MNKKLNPKLALSPIRSEARELLKIIVGIFCVTIFYRINDYGTTHLLRESANSFEPTFNSNFIDFFGGLFASYGFTNVFEAFYYLCVNQTTLESEKIIVTNLNKTITDEHNHNKRRAYNQAIQYYTSTINDRAVLTLFAFMVV